MMDELEHALFVAEIAELQKQQSEANIRAIYLRPTGDQQAGWQRRDSRIVYLRRQLAALDQGGPGLIRGAPRAGAARSQER